jgi:predicted O-methyltransferase YrrM
MALQPEQIVKRILPGATIAWYRRVRLTARARHLARRLADTSNPEEWWTWLNRFPQFRPIQKRGELIPLLDVVVLKAAHHIGEIGTASGGTLCALARAARPDANLITVDLDLTPERQAAFSSFTRGSQKIICLTGNSHDDHVVQQFAALLNGARLDVLLIDGDHSYEGVCRDWAMYAPLVREGGLIVLHDIIQDHGQRYGIATTAYTGGVPRFWAELKARYSDVEEIIEDSDQDGCGLGIVRWMSAG